MERANRDQNHRNNRRYSLGNEHPQGKHLSGGAEHDDPFHVYDSARETRSGGDMHLQAFTDEPLRCYIYTTLGTKRNLYLPITGQ